MQTSVAVAYMVAVIVLVVFFACAVISANAISFKPNRSDVGQRRLWFWVFGLATLVVSFLVNYFCFYNKIEVPSQADSYMLQTIISSVVSFVVYIVAGLAVSKSTNGKLSNWF